MKAMRIMFVLTMTLMTPLLYVHGGAFAAENFKMPTLVTVSVNSAQSEASLITMAWSPLHSKDTGVNWRTKIIGGQSAASLKRSEIQLNTDVIESTSDAIEGNYLPLCTRDGSGQFRVASQGWGNYGGLALRGDNPIKTIEDIRKAKQVRYGVPSIIPTINNYLDGFGAWFGIGERFVKIPYSGWPGVTKALADGAIDIAFFGPTMVDSIQMESGPYGIWFLDLDPKKDPAGFARFRQVCPKVEFAVNPSGVKTSVGKYMTLQRFHYNTMADMDAEFIYRWVKWLDINFDQYKDKHWRIPLMELKYFVEDANVTYVPIHDGAIRYLKEVGKWTDAMERRQRYNIKLTDWYNKAYAEAIVLADKRAIKVEPTNNEWFEFWKKYQKDIGIPRFRLMTDPEITTELPKLK